MKVEISIGELVDRAAILSIKRERIRDDVKLANIEYEYGQLKKAMESIGMTERDREFLELRAVNERLWVIEDRLREKENRKEFDDQFIELARSVYIENDLRAAIKRRINIARDSRVIEEKSYTVYRQHE